MHAVTSLQFDMGDPFHGSHDRIAGSSVELTEVTCFKLNADQGLDFHWIAGSSISQIIKTSEKIEDPLLGLAKSIYYFTRKRKTARLIQLRRKLKML